jgi:hypothetical protein
MKQEDRAKERQAYSEVGEEKKMLQTSKVFESIKGEESFLSVASTTPFFAASDFIFHTKQQKKKKIATQL